MSACGPSGWTRFRLTPRAPPPRSRGRCPLNLAVVAKSLERAGHSSEAVAGFLTRCLFSMFAEDVELLPGAASRACWRLTAATGRAVAHAGGALAGYGRGRLLRRDCARRPKFNGKLFKTPDTLPLSPENIDAPVPCRPR